MPEGRGFTAFFGKIRPLYKILAQVATMRMRAIFLTGIGIGLVALLLAGLLWAAGQTAPAPAAAVTADDCGVLRLEGTPITAQQMALQAAVSGQLSQLNAPARLPTATSSLNVTPIPAHCLEEAGGD